MELFLKFYVQGKTKTVEVKDDDGQFIYALPINRSDKRGRYNPYDLQVVSAHQARSCARYWTASATSVTLVSCLCLTHHHVLCV